MPEEENERQPDPRAFAELRIDYAISELSQASMRPNPLEQFRHWLDEAVASGIEEPNAMTLATVSTDGAPSSRIVLLKGLDAAGFYFYTNYMSRKGRELAGNPSAALVFHWKPLERQVNVCGAVKKIDRKESEAYFKTRPYESQIGAWVSTQSEKIESRAWLEARRDELTNQYPPGKVPLPEFWGGYVLAPSTIEFWQGRPGRLHDRIFYERNKDASWKTSRLSP